MRLNKDYVWPIIGLAAVGFSAWLLFHQLRDISFDDIVDSLNAIPVTGWLLSDLATLLAYAPLAGYDRLALMHLRKKISWGYIAAASFTAAMALTSVGNSRRSTPLMAEFSIPRIVCTP